MSRERAELSLPHPIIKIDKIVKPICYKHNYDCQIHLRAISALLTINIEHCRVHLNFSFVYSKLDIPMLLIIR